MVVQYLNAMADAIDIFACHSYMKLLNLTISNLDASCSIDFGLNIFFESIEYDYMDLNCCDFQQIGELAQTVSMQDSKFREALGSLTSGGNILLLAMFSSLVIL